MSALNVTDRRCIQSPSFFFFFFKWASPFQTLCTGSFPDGYMKSIEQIYGGGVGLLRSSINNGEGYGYIKRKKGLL